MATYLFALLSFALPSALDPIPMRGHDGFVLIIFIVSFVLPAINLLLFKIFGSIKSLTMRDRKDRIVPFCFSAVLYLVVTFFFARNYSIGMADNVLKLMVIMNALMLVATIITFFYKISIHSIALAGLVGIVLPLNRISDTDRLFIPTLALILLTGIVMSSRLQLNAHSPRQVMMGSLVGFTTGMAGVMILF
jgi:membrane-associated phospholipid phosphatase